MTEQELRDWFSTQPVQPQDFVEETVVMLSGPSTKHLFSLAGEKITDQEAEKRAAIRRNDFVESIRVLKAGGALGPDMWRPKI